MEFSIHRCADKYQTSGSRDRPAHIRRPGLRHTLCVQFLERAERHAPGDIAGLRINGRHLAPGRLLAGPVLVRIPEEVAFAEGLTIRPDAEEAPVLTLDDLVQIRRILGVDEQVTGLRVVRHATPVPSPDPRRKDNPQLRTVLRIGAAGHRTALQRHQVPAELLMFRSDGGNFFGLKTVPRQRPGLHRKGLRGPGLVAAPGERIVGNHRTLFHAPQRLTCDAVPGKEQTLLSDSCYGRNRLTPGLRFEEYGRSLQIVVPVIVVCGLEMPFQLAGHSVQRHDGRAVQVGTFPVPAVEIRSGCTERDIEDSSHRIDSDEAPGIQAGTVRSLFGSP